MTNITKNYKTDGGDTLVIGGTLRVEEGATVEGIGGDSGPVAWADVTDKPATFAPTIGTTATTAAAGNHTHTFTALSGSVADAAGANLQAILNDLAARVAALEV